MSRFGSDAALVFEEADITDVVVTVFDAPVLTDGAADGRGGQGYLAGMEGYVAGLLPEAGSSVLVPSVTGDADGGLDQPAPVGSKAPGQVEGFDQTWVCGEPGDPPRGSDR